MPREAAEAHRRRLREAVRHTCGRWRDRPPGAGEFRGDESAAPGCGGFPKIPGAAGRKAG